MQRERRSELKIAHLTLPFCADMTKKCQLGTREKASQHRTCQDLGLGLPGLQTHEQHTLVVPKPLGFWCFLSQPEQTKPLSSLAVGITSFSQEGSLSIVTPHPLHVPPPACRCSRGQTTPRSYRCILVQESILWCISASSQE